MFQFRKCLLYCSIIYPEFPWPVKYAPWKNYNKYSLSACVDIKITQNIWYLRVTFPSGGDSENFINWAENLNNFHLSFYFHLEDKEHFAYY